MEKLKKYFIIFILILLTFTSLFYFIGFKKGQNSFKENGFIIKEGNITYSKHFDPYYGLYYQNDQQGITLQIQNPCLTFVKISGQSMLPYYNNETISLIDTCFPPDKLKIGDVIIFYYDWNMTTTLHHRVVDINYEKEWIKTRGDNLKDEDNFINFNQVLGKEIGVLNILDDQKVVKEIYNNKTDTPLICVCSSNSILKVCGPDRGQLMTDNFVITNNLKEENCIFE